MKITRKYGHETSIQPSNVIDLADSNDVGSICKRRMSTTRKQIEN